MFEWKIDGRSLCIRDVQSESEFHTIEDIQKEAWGFNDLDTVPAATLMATQHAGGIVLGAFDGDKMIGFAHGFAAYEEGRTSIHSHMLAVRPAYRNFQAGFRLKLAQRERVLEKGLDEISWTYDPLQSLNAHLNFAKLGVISQRYLVNFYGEATSSPLHQGFGTDRLWVRWLLNTERVKTLASLTPHSPAARNSDSDLDISSSISVALVARQGDQPYNRDFSRLSGDRCTIEIPHNINALKERDPQAGIAWRNATGEAFLAAIDAGFEVTNFLRVGSNTNPRWFYLLTRGSYPR
jgi:predicted GNAT superfamily acetyltransferase